MTAKKSDYLIIYCFVFASILCIAVLAKLKSIDLMHFSWNIGNRFKKSDIETATFIEQVFAAPFEKVEISTIKRKLRVEGTCKIKLAEEIEPNVLKPLL